MARIAVVGAGYVGLVTGACLARLGHTVVCLEVDKEKVRSLKRGITPISEPGLDDLLAAAAETKQLRFSSNYSKVAAVDYAILAVPTPPSSDGSADTSYVLQAVRAISAHCRPGLILVIKSTVPVGTADEISRRPELRAAGIEVVSNPEFLRQGTAVHDFLHPDRVVIGASSLQAAVDVARLYAHLDAPIVAVSRRSAELAKYTANAFLATRISFMNEVAHIATAVDADIEEVARIIGMDQRIGPAFLKAGLGWGGSCFPKDVLALSSIARGNGCETPILNAAYETNERQSEHTARKMLDAVRNGRDPLITILGLAFKPETDDVRGSPALSVARRLLDEGVAMRAHDPLALGNASRIMPELEYCDDPYAALDGADAVLLATDWRHYLALDWALIRELMRGNTIFDGRNFLDGPTLQKLGFRYLSFGRPSLNGHSRAPIDGADLGEGAWPA